MITESSALSLSLPLPSPFGRYTLLERLGVGGMAEVFRSKIVLSHGFEKMLVIKRILPHLAADKNFVSMFIDEAKLTAQLTHPKIVQILDFGDVTGQYFITLELVDGFDGLVLLRRCAQKGLRLPAPLAVFVIMDVLEALDYAHNATDMDDRPMHIVHRDISPSNIFISKGGDVKLGDFGIAHTRKRESKTKSGTLKGKHGYMSPEQVNGTELDGRSDLYSIGVVLAEMLMGRRLFVAPSDLDIMLMVREGRLDRLDQYGGDMPPMLDSIVRCALRTDPAERYQNAAAFRDALADYLLETGQRVSASDLRTFGVDLFEGADPTARPQRPPKSVATTTTTTPPAHTTSAKSAAAITAASTPAARSSVAAPSTTPATARSSGTIPAVTTPATARSSGTIPAVMTAHTTTPATPAKSGVVAAAMPPAASQPAALASTSGTWSTRTRSGTLPPTWAPTIPDIPDPIAATVAAPLSSAPAAGDSDQWGARFEISAVRGTIWAPAPDSVAGEVEVPAPAARGEAPASAVSAVSAVSDRPGAPAPRNEVGRFVSSVPARLPDSAGDVGVISPMRIFSELAVARETGLLRFEFPDHAKEIYFIAGAPDAVTSSRPGERFGEYLVSKGALRFSDLERALAALPQYAGRLGDTLVGLRLMKPLDVFHMLSRQVRERISEIFTWTEGTFAFFRGVTTEQRGFPLGLDPFELLGAGVLGIPSMLLERSFSTLMDRRPCASGRTHIAPDRFLVGPTPGEVLRLLDGKRTLRAWMSQLTVAAELMTFLRTLYLLVETDLVRFD